MHYMHGVNLGFFVSFGSMVAAWQSQLMHMDALAVHVSVLVVRVLYKKTPHVVFPCAGFIMQCKRA